MRFLISSKILFASNWALEWNEKQQTKTKTCAHSYTNIVSMEQHCIDKHKHKSPESTNTFIYFVKCLPRLF